MATEFRLLGDIEARADGRSVDLGHLRQRCVLVALLVEANRVVQSTELVDRVWAGRPPHSAKATLYGYLSRLRKTLAPMEDVEIIRQSGGYLIRIDETLIDLHRFRAQVRQARMANHDSALALFEQALTLWRGDALGGMDIPWFNGVRDTLSKERFAAELDYTDLRLRHGRHTELVAELALRAHEHGSDERVAAQLMMALYRCGRQADALAHYEQTRTRLAEELGVDPGPALRQLHQQILSAHVAVSTSGSAHPAVAAPPVLTDRAGDGELAAPDSQLGRATRELATAISRQWTAEVELRSLHRPAPVRVRWSATDRPVAAPTAAVLGEGADTGQPRQLAMHGDLTDVSAKFRALPARQLVVLGEPGAGKTVLAILLTLGLLADRAPSDPTPVLLPLSSWNPHRDHLHTWLARRLLAEYPGLGNAATYGPDASTRLVTEGRVIPILDGLDETAPESHAAAIDALDQAIAGGRPLVVICRSAEYEHAVRRGGGILARAAVVEIEPVELEDAITFLTARHRVGDTRWQPVVKHLRCHRNGSLAQALTTPLMVDLARTAYAHAWGDPTELLDTNRFPDRATIEEHLIDAFLPAIYAQRPPPPTSALRSSSARRYRSEQATRWLSFLACHLQQRHTQDLAWWQLVHMIPRPTRGLVFGLPAAILFAITGLLVAGPVVAMAYGLSTALGGCVVHGLGRRPEPVHVEPRFRGTAVRFLGRFAIGIAISVVIGVAWSLPVNVVVPLATVFGFGIGLHVWLETPTEANRASSPVTTLLQDRVATLAFALSIALSLGLFYALAIAMSEPSPDMVGEAFHLDRALPGGVVSALFGWFTFRHIGSVGYGLAGIVLGGLAMPHHIPLSLGLVAGGLFGLAIGLSTVLSRSWGACALTRTWLALRGHTPLRLNRFLEDAHQRGVLRQAGAVYQFRHARLQNRLANPNGDPAPHRRGTTKAEC